MNEIQLEITVPSPVQIDMSAAAPVSLTFTEDDTQEDNNA